MTRKKSSIQSLTEEAFEKNSRSPAKPRTSARSVDDTIENILNDSLADEPDSKKNASPVKKQRAAKAQNLDDLVATVHHSKPAGRDSAPKELSETSNLETAIKQTTATVAQQKQTTPKPLSATPDKDAETLDELVENSHLPKTEPTQSGTIIIENATEKGRLFSGKNNFIFKYTLIALTSVFLSLAGIYYLSKNITSAIHSKIKPEKVLERIDRELVIYQQQQKRLPAELVVLISFPDNAVEWPFKYRMIQNIEGKPEIIFNPEKTGNYTLYYRLNNEILMKERGRPVRKINTFP